MRVLITNDDGIDSPGLLALTRAVDGLGLDVVVAAPHVEQSGTGAAMTVLEQDGRMTVHPRALDGVDGEVFAVEGTPAFIVMAAARGGFGDPPELVLSGVNVGPNTGTAVVHSGTVGAALTGTLHGLPGIAFSLDGERPTHWDTATTVARSVLRWVLDDLDRLGPYALNVNVPDVGVADLNGLRTADLATAGEVEAQVGERGEGYVTFTVQPVEEPPEPGSDVALLAEGWATATLLRGPAAVADPQLPEAVDGAAPTSEGARVE